MAEAYVEDVYRIKTDIKEIANKSMNRVGSSEPPVDVAFGRHLSIPGFAGTSSQAGIDIILAK